MRKKISHNINRKVVQSNNMYKYFLILFLVIPNLIMASKNNENQHPIFSLFGFTIDGIFEKEKYITDMWMGVPLDENNEPCKSIDIEGNFNHSCYENTISDFWHLSKDTPPPKANSHFSDYYIKFEKESLKINKITGYSEGRSIQTKKECNAIRDTLFELILKKYQTDEYSNKYDIYFVEGKDNEFFPGKSSMSFYETNKFGTKDEYRIHFELFCFVNSDNDIRIKAELDRDYPESVIDILESYDVDTTGF